MTGSAHLNISLGLLIGGGGIYGYVRKGSRASLIAGMGIGSLLLGSGYMIWKTDRVFEGHTIAATSTGIMTLAMGQRYMAGGKFMPAGLVATIGALGCAYNIKKAIEWAPSSSSSSKKE